VSEIEIIRASDHKVMRWKNGGGETAEIAASPQGAALDAFDWRLSMARVETDGPFSAFPGIDRTLAILEGEGIRLSVAGEPVVILTKMAPPHSFAADADTSANLVDGPILDLNMMSRRGRVQHSLERRRISGDADIPLSGPEGLIFCAEGAIQLRIAGTLIELKRHDTLHWAGEGRETSVQGAGLIYLIFLRQLAG
jgi:environmental stress-induced protein Ves